MVDRWPAAEAPQPYLQNSPADEDEFSLMRIGSTAIHQWADTRDAWGALPILVRRLVQATTPGLTELTFPGGDAVSTPGFDGRTVTSAGTPWVPEGVAVWEMGCDRKPGSKATSDYEKRTRATDEAARRGTSFVFVTPRLWTGKQAWIDARNAEDQWKVVRAYDATDLDTWLETSEATSLWLAGRLGLMGRHDETPLAWLARWSNVAEPSLPAALLLADRDAAAELLIEKLRAPGRRALTIVGDDRGEAIAFVVAALRGRGAWDLLDRMIVTSRPDRVRAAPDGPRPIVIVNVEAAEAVQPDLGAVIVVRPYARGRLNVKPDISLPFVRSDSLRKIVAETYPDREDDGRLVRHCGHSVTVLRRRLADDPAVRSPAWARAGWAGRAVLSFALAGSWQEERDADLTVLDLLSNQPADERPAAQAEVLALDGAPILRFGRVCVCVSQLDALFALGTWMTEDDLQRLLDVVEMVFAERDPALDLPRDQWWSAAVHGRAPPYSGALVAGLGNTLGILGVHGAAICGERLGIDVEGRVGALVRRLLTDLSEEDWLSRRGRLSALAEAAPAAFLDCLEAELARPQPAIGAIMNTVEGPFLGECLCTNLNWALEILAWEPIHLARVSEILLGLCRFETTDNAMVQPTATLASLFRPWWPMTSASTEQRADVLGRLLRRDRERAFELCLSVLPDDGWGSIAVQNAKPRWRRFTTRDRIITDIDLFHVQDAARRSLLDAGPFSVAEFEGLIERFAAFPPDDRARLMRHRTMWREGGAPQKDVARLREVARGLLQRPRLRDDDEEERGVRSALRILYAELEPTDPVERHRWLFAAHYVDCSDEIERLGHDDNEAYLRDRRAEAITEIHAAGGTEAVFDFAVRAGEPRVAGLALMRSLPEDADVSGFVRCAAAHPQQDRARWAVQELLAGVPEERFPQVVMSAAAALEENRAAVTFLAECMPGCPVGWSTVENLGADAAERFWSVVRIDGFRLSNDELRHAVDRLLDADRPRAALAAASHEPQRLPAEAWVRVLRALPGSGETGSLPGSHRLTAIFEILDEADDLSVTDVAQLELPFVRALDDRRGRVMALHRCMGADHQEYVWFLARIYGRDDEEMDPPELRVDDPEFAHPLGQIAVRLLWSWRSYPGLQEDGSVDEAAFMNWNKAARSMAAEVGRGRVADVTLGEAYGHARPEADGTWPPRPIRDLLDRPDAADLRRGFMTGVRNSRGMRTKHFHEGGDQERRLAERYEGIALGMENSHPRLAAVFRQVAGSYRTEAKSEDDDAALRDRW